MWRVENIVECSPRRNFRSRYLSASNLIEGKGHVDVGVRWCVGARVRECELAHIVVGMLPDKLKGGGVVIHYSLITFFCCLQELQESCYILFIAIGWSQWLSVGRYSHIEGLGVGSELMSLQPAVLLFYGGERQRV